MFVPNPGLIIGFHGCDESVVRAVVNQKSLLKESTNSYDWLGHGMYFWEGNYDRALSYARRLMTRPDKKAEVKNPAVLGAVIVEKLSQSMRPSAFGALTDGIQTV